MPGTSTWKMLTFSWLELTNSTARLETTPLLSGERDWQAAVLRVVPVREECHAATRMYTSQIVMCHRPHANITAQNIIGLEYKVHHWRSVIEAEIISPTHCTFCGLF